MQAMHHWFHSLAPTLMPHEHDDMACSKQRPTLNLATSGLLKRARSNSVLDFPSPRSPTMGEMSPYKRLKTDGDVKRVDLQVQPAAQEHYSSLPRSPPLTAPSSAAALPTSSPSHHGDQTSQPSSHAEPSTPAAEPPRESDHSFSPTSHQKMDPSKRQKAQDKIRAQFDLEILLKHDELRLIEQELAKVHIALEQLRRCQQIPFPGDPASMITHDQFVDGTGPAIAPPEGMSRPSHPATWGVTDGPYSRHYAKWLLPDPQFNSQPAQKPRQATGGKRAVASSGLNETGAPGSHRRQRTTTGGGRSQASTIDNHPSVPTKEKAPHSPQILRRPDGQLVKLRCKDCGKEDVSSVQGFLNHCRIAHRNDVKSHADAAIQCGVPIDGPEAAVPPTPTTPAVVAEPANMPLVSQQRAHNLVHPLNTPQVASHSTSFLQGSSTAPRPSEETLLQTSPVNFANLRGGSALYSMPTTPGVPSPLATNVQNSSAFVPSPHVSNLSTLVQRSGGNGSMDLAQLVASATQKIDLDQVEPLIPDDEAEEEPAVHAGAPKRPQRSTNAAPSSATASRAPAPGARLPNKPPSIEVPQTRRMGPSSQASFVGFPSSSPQVHDSQSLSPFDFVSGVDTHMTDLSPRTNPPGLMTDREDDDDMEDETKSVVEHPSASQNNVRIYGDHNDLDMTGVRAESKGTDHQWAIPALAEPPVPPVALDEAAARSRQRKPRGRPKKGKEKTGK